MQLPSPAQSGPQPPSRVAHTSSDAAQRSSVDLAVGHPAHQRVWITPVVEGLCMTVQAPTECVGDSEFQYHQGDEGGNEAKEQGGLVVHGIPPSCEAKVVAACTRVKCSG